MKKLLIAGGLVALGIAAFLFNSGTTTNNSASASTESCSFWESRFLR